MKVETYAQLQGFGICGDRTGQRCLGMRIWSIVLAGGLRVCINIKQRESGLCVYIG